MTDLDAADRALALADRLIEERDRLRAELAQAMADVERLKSGNQRYWEGRWRDEKAENENLREALEESVKLQSHYAKLLNMHDGGKRMWFADADAWLARLASLAPESGTAEGRE